MRAFAASKRGRPRRAANDNPTGEARGRDLGTPEQLLQRALRAEGCDPVAGAHPLDLLLAKGLIHAREQAAGLRYAALYRRLIGRTEVSYGRFYDGLAGRGAPASAQDEAELQRAERRLRAAKAELLAGGQHIARATEAVCVFGHWPRAGQEECRVLRAGLARLADSFAKTCD